MKKIVCCSAMLILFFPLIFAWAHQVHVSASVKGGFCYVQGAYSQSRKAGDALVEVFNSQGIRLLQGRTDSSGEFSFRLPDNTDLKITLTTRLGHKSDLTLYAGEHESQERLIHEEPPSPDLHHEYETEKDHSHEQIRIMEPDQLQKMIDHTIEHALEEKLEPLYALAEKMEAKRERMTYKALAGIGYIVGIFGLALFFVSRKKKG